MSLEQTFLVKARFDWKFRFGPKENTHLLVRTAKLGLTDESRTKDESVSSIFTGYSCQESGVPVESVSSLQISQESIFRRRSLGLQLLITRAAWRAIWSYFFRLIMSRPKHGGSASHTPGYFVHHCTVLYLLMLPDFIVSTINHSAIVISWSQAVVQQREGSDREKTTLLLAIVDKKVSKCGSSEDETTLWTAEVHTWYSLYTVYRLPSCMSTWDFIRTLKSDISSMIINSSS